MTPRQLGPWLLERPLGRGGMGEVWLARHHGLRIPVALKLLSEDASRRPGLRAVWEMELQAQARMHHPGIVHLRDRGRVTEAEARLHDDWEVGRSWAALEWVDGYTLRTRVGRIHWDDVRAMVLRLLDALAHCHARGVVHRDLKPSNVLVDERGWPHLTDFGLAHLTDRLPQPEVRYTPAGTPGYMAPEQFHAHWRDFGPGTDLYGLGCLVWQLLTGRVPFNGGDFRTVAQQHRKQAPPPLESLVPVPDGVEDWLGRLLAKRVEDRPASAAEAARELMALPTLARRAPPSSGAGPCLRRMLVSAPELPAQWSYSGTTAPPLPAPGVGRSLVGLAEPPLVARAELMDVLWDDLRAVLGSRSLQVRVIEGGVGVGKSRLASWLGHRAEELGLARTMWSPLSESPNGRELWLRGLAAWGLEEEALRARLQRLTSGDPLSDGLAWSGLAAWLHGESVSTFGEVDAVAGLQASVLAQLARRHPVVLVLDGIEASSSQLRLVEALERVAYDAPILVLLTSTEGVLPDHPRLQVGALDVEQGRQLVRSLAGLDPQLVESVVERTGGNPMFALQLVAAWARRRVLHAGPRGLTLRDDNQEVPASLAVTWLRRVEALLVHRPTTVGPLFELAAIAGPQLTLQRWQRLASLANLADPAPVLEGLLDDGLMVRTADDALGWVHGLAREALITRSRHGGRFSSFNRVIARELLASAEASPMAVGTHLLEGGQAEEAQPRLLLAVQRRYRRGELHRADQAGRLWVRAMEDQGIAASDPRWTPGRIQFVKLARAMGDGNRVREELRALEAHPHGDDAKLEVRRARAWLLSADGELRQAVPLLSDALTVARETGSLELHAELAWDLGAQLRAVGRLDEAAPCFAEAAEQWKQLGDAFQVARCVLAQAQVLLLRGHLAEAQEHLTSLDVPAAGPGWLVRARREALWGDLQGAMGRLPEAEARWQRAARALDACGDPQATSVRWRLASLSLERGRADLALDAAEQVLAEGRLRRDPTDLARGHLLLAASQAFRSRWRLAETALTEARAGFARTGAVDSHAPWVAERLAQQANRCGRDTLARDATMLLLELGVALGAKRWVDAAHEMLAQLGSDLFEVLG